jgi:hypothetical protein
MAVFDPTCPIIKALILLDSEGKRIAVKYYGSEWWATKGLAPEHTACDAHDGVPNDTHICRPTVATQANFEKTLWAKTSRTNARQEGEAQPRVALH